MGEAVTAVVVDDDTPPTINISHRLSNGIWLDAAMTLFEYSLDCRADWSGEGPSQVTASDNCRGTPVIEMFVNELPEADAGDWTKVSGTYTIRYEATDSSGNWSEAFVSAVIGECIEGEEVIEGEEIVEGEDVVEGEEVIEGEDVEVPETYPFDEDSDGVIDADDFEKILEAWREGDFPMTWAVRGLYIFKSGGNYYYDDDYDPPLCWIPGEAPVPDVE